MLGVAFQTYSNKEFPSLPKCTSSHCSVEDACMASLLLRRTIQPLWKPGCVSAGLSVHSFFSTFTYCTLPQEQKTVAALSPVCRGVKCDWWLSLLFWGLLAAARFKTDICTKCTERSPNYALALFPLKYLERLRERRRWLTSSLTLLCNFF